MNGHKRLKEDELHHAYFVTNKVQIQKKDTTDIENKLQMLISLFKEKSELLVTQYNDLLHILNEIVDQLLRSNPIQPHQLYSKK